jgi:group I intron endonuclease
VTAGKRRVGALYRIDFDNGKSYVGITLNPVSRRMALHRNHAKAGRDCALHRAMRKYGEGAFKCRVLVRSDNWDYLCLLEQRAIVAFGTRYPTGYNLTDGGEGNVGYKMADDEKSRRSAAMKGQPLSFTRPAGWKHTEEARRQIAEAGRGREFCAERRARIGRTKLGNTYNVGRTVSEETRKKIAAPQIGRPKSAEAKAAMSAARKGQPWTEARRAAQKRRSTVPDGAHPSS